MAWLVSRSKNGKQFFPVLFLERLKTVEFWKIKIVLFEATTEEKISKVFLLCGCFKRPKIIYRFICLQGGG